MPRHVLIRIPATRDSGSGPLKCDVNHGMKGKGVYRGCNLESLMMFDVYVWFGDWCF